MREALGTRLTSWLTAFPMRVGNIEGEDSLVLHTYVLKYRQVWLSEYITFYNITKVKRALWLVRQPSTTCLLVHAKKSYAIKLRQIQQISSPVRFKMHWWNIQMKSWSWRKFSVVVLKESEKIKRQICLGEIHHCFLRGWKLRRTTERAKFLKDLSPKFKVHFVCFYSRKNSVLK